MENVEKKSKSNDDDQAAFRKAAREAGCDDNEERFKDALRKVGNAKPTPSEKNRDEKGE